MLVSRPNQELLTCDVIDPRADSRWDALIQGHPDATVFHTAAWARVLCQTYGHRPNYLRVKRGDQLVALIPLMEVSSPITGRRGVGLPFTDVCCPLLFADIEADLFWNAIRAEARMRKWKYIEMRGSGFGKETKGPNNAILVHALDLRGTQSEISDRFAGSVRTAIRKAERNEVTVRVSVDKESALEYYRLHALTRRRHGLPPQSFAFFERIRSELMVKGRGFTVIASRKGRAIAGAVFLHFNGGAVYKFGASDEAGRMYCANNLALWEGIKCLKEMGMASLHFGRSEANHESLLRFKRAWGASEVPIDYVKINPITGSSITRKDLTSGLHTQVFRRLPLSINRFLGKLLYSHLD